MANTNTTPQYAAVQTLARLAEIFAQNPNAIMAADVSGQPGGTAADPDALYVGLVARLLKMREEGL